MTISAQTRKLLWSRAHDICSFTSCWQALTADQVDEATGEKSSVVNGEEAHIRSPSTRRTSARLDLQRRR